MDKHDCSPQDPSKTRRLKVVLPQCYAALAIFAVTLSHEIFESACYVVTLRENIELTPRMAYGWIKCIGLLLGGIVGQIIGPRVMMILAAGLSVAGWIILEWIYAEALLRWTIYIVALAWGMMQAPCLVYLAEVSQPNMRNALMLTMFMPSGIGLIYFNLASDGTIKVAALVNIVFALFGLVLMFCLPNSPYWLASKGRYHAAESSLAWFRGQTTVENVKTESKTIISNARNSPTACKIFGQAPLYVAALIVGYVFSASAFIRIFAVKFSAYTSMMLLRLGYDESTFYSSVFFCTVLISIGFVVLIAIIGKRTMILISLFGGSMPIFAASIAGYILV